MQGWAWLLCNLFCNHNYQGDTGEVIYKDSIYGNKHLFSNMIDHKPHKYRTPPELPSSQMATYFAQPTQPFFALQLQLATQLVGQLCCYIKAALLNKDSKQLASYIARFLAKQQSLQIQFSNTQLQYKSFYITITEINTNIYEYTVNRDFTEIVVY